MERTYSTSNLEADLIHGINERGEYVCLNIYDWGSFDINIADRPYSRPDGGLLGIILLGGYFPICWEDCYDETIRENLQKLEKKLSADEIDYCIAQIANEMLIDGGFTQDDVCRTEYFMDDCNGYGLALISEL